MIRTQMHRVMVAAALVAAFMAGLFAGSVPPTQASLGDVGVFSQLVIGQLFPTGRPTAPGIFLPSGGLSYLGSLSDVNGNVWLSQVATASAVDGLTLTNAATGGTVSLAATGTDANVPFTIASKGTGSIVLQPNALAALTIPAVASAVNGATLTQSAIGNMVQFAFTGSDTNGSLAVLGKGTGGVAVGSTSATPVLNHFSGTATLTPGSVGAAAKVATTMTITGAVTTNTGTVYCSGAASPGVIAINAFVSAANTVTVEFVNASAAAITPTSQTYRCDVWQH